MGWQKEILGFNCWYKV